MKKNFLRRILSSAFVFIAAMLVLAGCSESPTLVFLAYPEKTVYFAGEDLDLSGAKLLLNAWGESVEIVPKDNPAVTYSGFDPDTLGNQTVTLYYALNRATLEARFSVAVVKPESSVVGIRVVPPDKNEYIDGQKFDPTGLRIYLKLADGSERAASLSDCALSVGETVSLKDNGAATVAYGDYRASFPIFVKPREAIALIFISNPKTVYVSGDAPDFSEAAFAFKFNDQSVESVAIDTNCEDFEVIPRVLTVSVTEVEVRYAGFTLTFSVTVNKKETVLDLQKETKAALDRILANWDTDAGYRAAYLTVGTIDLGTLTVDGRPIGNASPVVTVTEPKTKYPAIEASADGSVRIHAYYLMSYATQRLALETREEIVTVILTEAEPSEYVTEGNRRVFSKTSAECAAVHFIKRADDAVIAAVRLTTASDGSVFVPTGFEEAALWRNDSVGIERQSFSPPDSREINAATIRGVPVDSVLRRYRSI